MLRLLLMVLSTVPAIAESQVGKETPVLHANPFVGTWTANMSKSRPHPDFRFQRVSLNIAVEGDSVTIGQVLVDGSGQEQRATETLRSDGVETAGTVTAGVTHIARWVGSHVLVTIAKKNGEMFFLATYEVSPDGKTLTARTSGILEQVIVFDRT
jgi:hypothetical protein